MILEDEFGDVVKKARVGNGFSHAELAAKSGVEAGRIQAFERYEQSPERTESDGLAKALHLHSEALWGIATVEYRPPTFEAAPGIVLERFTFPEMNSNGFLVHFEASADTFLIDPGGDPAAMVQRLQERGWELGAILLTHGHSDHVAGVESLRRDVGDVPVYAHPEEWQGEGLVATQAGSTLELGAQTIHVIPSGGHTLHGIVFHFTGAAIAAVGDTLFAGSLGGPMDGARHYPSLLRSAEAILNLPAETLLLPGHGPVTTVGLEREHNPFVKAVRGIE